MIYIRTHVNISAHVWANECFLHSELLALNEGVYFHRVEWRKIEHVYSSEHCSPFHSSSCVNMTDVQIHTMCMYVCWSCKRRGNTKANAPLSSVHRGRGRDKKTGRLPWLRIFNRVRTYLGCCRSLCVVNYYCTIKPIICLAGVFYTVWTLWN